MGGGEGGRGSTRRPRLRRSFSAGAVAGPSCPAARSLCFSLSASDPVDSRTDFRRVSSSSSSSLSVIIILVVVIVATFREREFPVDPGAPARPAVDVADPSLSLSLSLFLSLFLFPCLSSFPFAVLVESTIERTASSVASASSTRTGALRRGATTPGARSPSRKTRPDFLVRGC